MQRRPFRRPARSLPSSGEGSWFCTKNRSRCSSAWGFDSGLLRADSEGRHSQSGFALTLKKEGGRETFTFTPTEWRKLTQGLTVLDDEALAPPAPFVSDEERYQAFRLFLYGSHGTHAGPIMPIASRFVARGSRILSGRYANGWPRQALSRTR